MGCAVSSLEKAGNSLIGTNNPLSHLFPTSIASAYPATRHSRNECIFETIEPPAATILQDPSVTPMHPPSSPGDDSVVAMARCGDCGHMVPETNLAIHQAHACGGRARRPSDDNRREENAPRPETSGMRQRRPTATAPSTLQAAAAAAAAPAAAPVRDNSKQRDVIDLASDDEVQVVEQPTNEWACPRCTLLNPVSDTSCGACQYDKNSQRSADPTRRERLVGNNTTQQQQQSRQQQPPSPGAFVGGGALLGSVLGAAGAAMRGESWVGGAMEGAMTGAMGGAVLGSTTNQMAQQQQAAARAQQQRQQPRSSFRVNHNGGSITTIVFSPDGRVQRRVVRGGPGGVDPLLGLMMANSLQNSPQQYHGMDIDGMSYEQLLAAFGDGSENRGADERVISSLPVSQVTEDIAPEKADADHASCPICLEVFKKGDLRKTLPCLHGFHDKCVDKWLRGNGSCPICKHVVSS